MEEAANMKLFFDADNIALSWLSAAIASDKHDSQPVLDRTVCIEWFDQGARIIATDGVLLIHAWAPTTNANAWYAPGDDEPPERRIVVFDPDGRGTGLLKYARKLCVAADKADEAHPDLSIEVRTAPPRPSGHVAMPGLEAECVVLEVPGAEKVLLDVIDGEYPSWQGVARQSVEPTDDVMFAAERLKQVALLGRIQGRPVRWRFSGQRLAVLEVEDTDLETGGVLMALRDPDAVRAEAS